MKVKLLRRLALCAGLIFVSGAVSGCNQNQQQKNATQGQFRHGGRHGLRSVCADDIQKYCANEDRVGRCLRQNMDKLSDACKTALAERHGHRNGGGDNNGDNGNQD
jgi:hypothetical protein